MMEMLLMRRSGFPRPESVWGRGILSVVAAVVASGLFVVLPADAALSKNSLIRFHAAGLSDEALIDKILDEGVSFPSSPAVQQELIAAGISAAILDAISKISATSGSAAVVVDEESEILGDQPREILAAFRAGHVAEAFVATREALLHQPQDPWLNCAAGEAALTLRDWPAVLQATNALKAIPADPRSGQCASRLEEELKVEQAESELRNQTLRLVHAGNLDGARRLVEDSQFNPAQKLLIDHYLDRAQAKFATALGRLSRLSREMPGSDAQLAKLRQETIQEAKAFQEPIGRANAYLYDPISTSTCTPDSARALLTKKQLFLEQYLKDVQQLAADYPSDHLVEQLYFHALLITSPYELVKSYGDEVLQRSGVLRVPFFSKQRMLLLSIDRTKSELRLEPDPEHPKNSGYVDGLQDDALFSLPYASIHAIRQQASTDLNTLGLSSKSVALQIEPGGGLAPYYGLMTLIHCIYGESYEKQATQRLGRFVAEEVHLTPSQAHLVDPTKNTKDILGGALSTLTLGTMVASSVGIQRQQQEAVYSDSARQTLAMQQNQAEIVQSLGAKLIGQHEQEKEFRREVGDAQLSDYKTLEGRLTRKAFRLAASMRIPNRFVALEQMLNAPNH
jgi:hypothetical protein